MHIDSLTKLLFISLSTVFFVFLALPSNAQAATYYVATNGFNSRTCIEAQNAATPKATIANVQTCLSPGDTVIVRPGVYNERVNVINSGLPGQPITFQGEPGAIVDGGDIVTGWAPTVASDPVFGAGIYKKTMSPGYNAASAAWNNKHIIWITDFVMQNTTPGEGGAWLLSRDPNFTWVPYRDYSGPFWDGVEALAGKIGDTVYIRIRDRRDPNNELITLAPNATGAFHLQDKNHVIIRGFTIRNAFHAIYTNNATDNIVEQNRLLGGYQTVIIGGDSARNHIRNNDITLDYIFADIGHPLNTSALADSVYTAFRVWEQYPIAVAIYGAGPDNQVYNNEIHHSFAGVWVINTPGADRLKVFGNTLHHNGGYNMYTDGMPPGFEFHDNLIYEGTYGIRLDGGPAGLAYIYRNRFYNITQTNDGSNIDFNDGGLGRLYFYHNSLSNSYIGITFFNDVRDKWWINNIISAQVPLWFDGTFLGTHFDYNWVGQEQLASWQGPNNVFKPGERIWDPLNPTWDLNSLEGQTARQIGINLSQPWTVDGVTHPPLPGMTSGYFTGSRPDAGAVQSGTIPPTFDFSLANGGARSVVQGQSVNNTITANLVSGTSQAVSFTTSGLPTGATYTYSPTSCSPACTTTFNITTLASTPTGNYTIIVTGTAGTLSRTTSFALAVTSTADTQPPSIPTGLTAGAISSSQINLSWTASTDNVGVTGYRVERCQGAGCSTFTQVSTPTGTTYQDTGLTANTFYSYRVRAVDAAGNLSQYSSIVSATTQASPPARINTLQVNLELEKDQRLNNRSFLVRIILNGQVLRDRSITAPQGILTLSNLDLDTGSYQITASSTSHLPRTITQSLTDNLLITFPSLLAGDLNHDGIINSLDWSLMNPRWNTSNAVSDLNGDNTTNSLDWSLMNKNWAN